MQAFLSQRYVTILKGIIIISAILFALSVFEITIGNITGFQPLVFAFGFLLYCAFNWADVFVFSLLWIILSLVLLRIKRKEFFWIVFFSFWLIRSTGEIIFSILQQFNPYYRPWLMYAPRAVMQNTWFGHFVLVRYWVVEQIFFQALAVLSLFGLLYTVIKLLTEKN